MLRSELAFIPNNLSSHSLHMTNFIEEEANEDNSEPKSSNPSKKHQEEAKNESKDSSFVRDTSKHDIVQKMAKEIQGLQYRLEVKNSVLDTPINLFNRAGRYEFTPTAFPNQDQFLVQTITDQLNQMEQREHSPFPQTKKQKKQQIKPPKRPSVHEQKEEIKQPNPFQQQDTDYSDISRDIKIYEHRYQSNLTYLSDQTKQLLSYYEFMINEQEQKQLRKQIMMLQIHNHRTKISLRNASYSKRFNFISPIHKNNDQPIEFRAKFKVKQSLVDHMDELAQRIKEEQALWEEQEAKISLLTKYYNIAKAKTIPNLQQDGDYRYDSKLERYTNQLQSIKNSKIAIDIPYSTSGFNITPTSSINATNFSRKSPILKKGLSPPQKRISPKKATQNVITQPYQKYNLLKYKTQLSKQMMQEYEVYNLGRLKRIKDENRMIKKELEFIDQHIEHFDKSFAEQMKKYEQMKKPKITYQTFQSIQQDTPFTKSPWSRDYFGNSKGCNTINLYRPDSKDPKLLKPTSKSRPAINKSLSQSKYTIKRDQSISMSNTRKDITLSQNFLTENEINSQKSDTVVSFFRNRVNSPQKVKQSENCIYTSRKQLASITQKSPNHSKKSISQRQFSPKSKKLLRFSHQSPSQQSIGKRLIKSPRPNPIKNDSKQETPSKRLVQSGYCLSPDENTSKY